MTGSVELSNDIDRRALVVVACSACGLFQRVPHLASADVARCPRCSEVLRRPSDNSAPLACACAAAVLFLFSLSFPLMSLHAGGQFFTGTIFTGPSELSRLGMDPLAALVVMTLVLAPALKILILLLSLLNQRTNAHPPWLAWIFGCLHRIAPWAMVEVFLLGTFVAYTRLRALAMVEIGPALIALVGLMLTLVAADASLDRHAIWDTFRRRRASTEATRSRSTPQASSASELMGCHVCDEVSTSAEGDACPLCHHTIHHRKPNSLERTWSLMLAAALLYIPANLLPVMTVTRFGIGSPHTILGGVIELFEDHLWPLGVLVFVASIVVPIAKLSALAVMLVATHKRSQWHLAHRAHVFRVVSSIGRWSMIDIFALTTLVALVRMGFLATVIPGDGALAFAGVVVLTMLATECFDPRLMWDAPVAAGKRTCDATTHGRVPESIT